MEISCFKSIFLLCTQSNRINSVFPHEFDAANIKIALQGVEIEVIVQESPCFVPFETMDRKSSRVKSTKFFHAFVY